MKKNINCNIKNYLVNSTFQEPKLSNNQYKYYNGNEVKGWKFNRAAIINNSKYFGFPTPYPCGQACVIQKTGSITQTFNVPKLGDYSLIIFYVGRNCCDNSGVGNSLSIEFNDKKIKLIKNPDVKKWNKTTIKLNITNLKNNKLKINGLHYSDRSTAIQLLLTDDIESDVDVESNVDYDYDINAVPVYVLGSYGIEPWGKNNYFPDFNAQWIWYTQFANSNAPDNSNTPIKVQYIYENKSTKEIGIKLNIIVDNYCDIFVNSEQLKKNNKEVKAEGGWGQEKNDWNMFLCKIKPGFNLFEFIIKSIGGPGGLLVSAMTIENKILFHTDKEWKFIPISYTPITSFNLSQQGLITDTEKSFPWGCLSLNGESTQFVNIGKIITGMNGLSFGCWFKSNNNKNFVRIFDFGNGKSNNNLCLYIYNNKIGFEIFTMDKFILGYKLNLPPNINNNKWYHLVLTIKPNQVTGSTCTFYLNNNIVSSFDYVYPINIERSNCYLGKSNWETDTRNFTGYLSNFVMFQKVLSEKEINALYMSMIDLNDPALYIYLPFSTNSVLDTLLNNYVGKTFSLPIKKSKIPSENWTCVEQEKNKWISVKMEEKNPICMSMDGQNCIEEETEKSCNLLTSNPIVPYNPIICGESKMNLSWCDIAKNNLLQTDKFDSKFKNEFNVNGTPIYDVKPGVKALSALDTNSEDELLKSKPLNGGKILSITNLNDLNNLMVEGTFKLRVNMPLMPPYIKGETFDIKKGQNQNYFYLCVEKLDNNCNIKLPNGNCIKTFADNKNCDNKALTSYVNYNTFRLVLVSSQYVLDPTIPIGNNSDFTIVKVNNQLYLKNIQTGYLPSIYSNEQVLPIYGDIEINNNTNVNKIYSQLNNTLCNQEEPTIQTSGTSFVKCDIKKDPGTYLITSKNIGTSSPIRININPDKTISFNLLSFNSYGYPTEVFALTSCKFNVKTFAFIEKITNVLGTFMINLVCFESTSNNNANPKNQLKFTVELVNFPKNFIKDNSIFDIN